MAGAHAHADRKPRQKGAVRLRCALRAAALLLVAVGIGGAVGLPRRSGSRLRGVRTASARPCASSLLLLPGRGPVAVSVSVSAVEVGIARRCGGSAA